MQAPYYLCCLAYVSMTVAATAFIFQASAGAQMLEKSYANIVDQLSHDLIFDLREADQLDGLDTSLFHAKPVKGRWSGSAAGCFCPAANKNQGIGEGVAKGACTDKQTRFGCTDVPATAARDLPFFKVQQGSLFTIRGRNTSFLKNYKHIDPDGNCSPGFRHCGDKRSLSRGVCVPALFGSCPFSDIRGEPVPDYSSLAVGGTTVFVTNAATFNPVSYTAIEQSHACFVRSHYPSTPGRTRYPLLEGNFDSCREDKAAWSVAQVGEAELFQVNQLPVAQLAGLQVSNIFRYKLMVARPFEWSPLCADLVLSFVERTSDIAEVRQLFKSLELVDIIYFVLSICGWSLLALLILTKNNLPANIGSRFRLTVMIRMLSMMAIAPVLIICAARARRFHRFFINVAQLGCSDSFTNEHFRDIASHIDAAVVSKVVKALGFGLSVMLLEAAVSIFYACNMPRFKNTENQVVPNRPVINKSIHSSSVERLTQKLPADPEVEGETGLSQIEKLRLSATDRQTSGLSPENQQSSLVGPNAKSRLKYLDTVLKPNA